MAAEPRLRVSVAALCRVVFPHPQTGAIQLALERRTAQVNGAVRVQAQPFGGALRIVDADRFRASVGEFDYDSHRSREEQDLRILIPPAAWNTAREFILSELRSSRSEIIETDPCRELEEEFMESAGMTLLPSHYIYQPTGISVQDQPEPTQSSRMPGAPTVRIYSIFEVSLKDATTRQTLLETSQRFTDEDLQAIADADTARGGRGRANGILVLPLKAVCQAYRSLDPAMNDPSPIILGHRFNSTAALLISQIKLHLAE